MVSYHQAITLLLELVPPRELGEITSQAEVTKKRKRIDIFRKWFSEAIMPLKCKDGSSIMVLPYSIGEPSYHHGALMYMNYSYQIYVQLTGRLTTK